MLKRLALAAALTVAALPAVAQMTAEVKFQPGNYGSMVSGTITGDEYFDYVLGAKGGQELFAELQAEVDALMADYYGVAIYNGSVNGNTARITLPEDGDYTIRVYLMGNDRDTGKTVGYNLDLSIQ